MILQLSLMATKLGWVDQPAECLGYDINETTGGARGRCAPASNLYAQGGIGLKGTTRVAGSFFKIERMKSNG